MQKSNLEQEIGRNCRQHPNSHVMGVCLKVDCKGTGRLVCFECLIGDNEHEGHSKNIVTLSSIDQTGICNGNWPQDEEGNKTKKFLQNLSKIKSPEGIDEQFDILNGKLSLEIEVGKEKVKTFFNDQYAQTAKYSCTLQQSFDGAYSLERIVELLIEYQRGTINDEELHQNISSFLKSDEQQSKLEGLRNILNQKQSTHLFTFDLKQFDNCSNETIKEIQTLSSSFISTFNTLGFEVAPVKNPSSVQATQDGNTYKWTHSSHSVVYTKQPIKAGRLKVRAQINSYTSGCYVVGIEKESTISNSAYWAQGIPACCITCKGMDAISMATNTPNEYIGHHFAVGKILQIELCPSENTFNIGIEGSNIQFKLNSFPLKEWEPCRLFFNNYSGTPSGMTILSSVLIN